MLSILAGQRSSESVGWAPWEGQRWLCRAGTKEREQKVLQGRNDQSHRSPPASALHFAFTRHQPGRSLLKSGVAKEPTPGSIHSTKPSWLVLCFATKPAGTGTSLSLATLGISQY